MMWPRIGVLVLVWPRKVNPRISELTETKAIRGGSFCMQRGGSTMLENPHGTVSKSCAMIGRGQVMGVANTKQLRTALKSKDASYSELMQRLRRVRESVLDCALPAGVLIFSAFPPTQELPYDVQGIVGLSAQSQADMLQVIRADEPPMRCSILAFPSGAPLAWVMNHKHRVI